MTRRVPDTFNCRLCGKTHSVREATRAEMLRGPMRRPLRGREPGWTLEEWI